jgi:hypothetical protein
MPPSEGAGVRAWRHSSNMNCCAPTVSRLSRVLMCSSLLMSDQFVTESQCTRLVYDCSMLLSQPGTAWLVRRHLGVICGRLSLCPVQQLCGRGSLKMGCLLGSCGCALRSCMPWHESFCDAWCGPCCCGTGYVQSQVVPRVHKHHCCVLGVVPRSWINTLPNSGLQQPQTQL